MADAADVQQGFAGRLVAYAVRPDAPPLRKAGPRRDWIDAMPERHAYRCLPLVIANQLGWDLINPASFTATWNGGAEPSDLRLRWAEGHWSELARSHFGHGILTFSVGYLFRTPPGVGLLVCGAPNLPMDGLQALTGMVETDWSPSTFTMNYQLTRPGHAVAFEAGQPFCRIVPVERGLVERLDPEIRAIAEDPELERQHRDWEQSRSRFIAESRIQFSPAHDQRWQKDYFQGKQPSGAPAPDHQTQLRHREFRDLRPPEQRPAAQPPPPKRMAPEPSREPPPPQPVDYSLLMAAGLLRDLTEAQRVEVLRQFCRACGREDPECPCMEHRIS